MSCVFPALPSPTHEWKSFLHTPTTASFYAATEKTGEIKFTSIEILWREWTVRNEMRQKTFVRSFTYTALQKLSIGPARWLVLLIELGAVAVLVLIRLWRQSRGKFLFAFLLFLLLLLSFDWRCFHCSAVKAENFHHQLFSLMKTRKRRRTKLFRGNSL